MSDRVILTVDRNRRNLDLLGRFLGQAGYLTCAAATLEELDAALEQPAPFALVLIDLAGFDREIWKRCERLRTSHIPFVVLSPQQSAAIQRESLAHGAHGIVIKPLVVKELLGVIGSLIGPATEEVS